MASHAVRRSLHLGRLTERQQTPASRTGEVRNHEHPSREERDATQGRHRTPAPDPGERQQVEGTRKDEDPRDEGPSGPRTQWTRPVRHEKRDEEQGEGVNGLVAHADLEDLERARVQAPRKRMGSERPQGDRDEGEAGTEQRKGSIHEMLEGSRCVYRTRRA